MLNPEKAVASNRAEGLQGEELVRHKTIRGSSITHFDYNLETIPPDRIMSKKVSLSAVPGINVDYQKTTLIRKFRALCFSPPEAPVLCWPFFALVIPLSDGVGSEGFPVPRAALVSSSAAAAASCDC